MDECTNTWKVRPPKGDLVSHTAASLQNPTLRNAAFMDEHKTIPAASRATPFRR